MRAVPALALVLGLGGCATLEQMAGEASLSEGRYAPVVTPQTKLNAELRSLPAPAHRIPVAVYDFPDLTGQFKDETNFQSLSKAVTQGGAPMLIKALQDAGERRWFTVLDRSSLQDLLKERQIVTEMRRVYRGEQQIDANALPPLDHASIILEGGIIGYDTNTLTGGAGASYLGIGGDTKWTQDTITVTLRAVSTKTSEVLASVTVNKVIASVALQGNVFRYVAMDKLLQLESGVTQNEPKQIAVQQAIEKAVMSLIVEGAELKIWSFGDKAAGEALIAQYNAEKYGDTITPDALAPLPPQTRNAAAVVQTRALPVSARQPDKPTASVKTYTAPAGGDPATAAHAPTNLPPPQGADGEVVG